MFICVAQNYDIIILFEINKLYILDFFCNTVDCDRTCPAHVGHEHREENCTSSFSPGILCLHVSVLRASHSSTDYSSKS